MKHIIFIEFLNNESFKLLNIKFLIEMIFVFKKLLGSDYQTKELPIKKCNRVNDYQTKEVSIKNLV